MKYETTPLISIIVAVFDGVATLQHCMDSVTQQTYPNKELIIIDGGSTDGTVELLKKNHDQIRYWISEPDRGIYNAWNKGLEQAHGEWICFLGADDKFWDAQALEKMAGQLKQLPPGIRVAYAQIMLLNDNGEQLSLVGEDWGRTRNRFKQTMCIPHQGVMHKRSLFELHGNFDETFRIAGDYEMLMRELKTADAGFVPGIILTAMRQGGVSSIPQNSLVLLREIRRAQKMHGQGFPGLIWAMAVGRTYLRLLVWKILGERQARKLLDVGRRIMGLPPFWTRT